MRKALVLCLGLVFAVSMLVAPAVSHARDEVEDTPLFSESLDNAKQFSTSTGGIQPRPIGGAADEAMQQLLTSEPYYTCDRTYPTCQEYVTCCHMATCDNISPTCIAAPTCAGTEETCEAFFTCGSLQFTCDGTWTCDLSCFVALTMQGTRTCEWWPTCWGGPTCDGTATCDDINETCGGYLTCNNATWDSHPTCGGKPTCDVNKQTCDGQSSTCWHDPVCVWPTVVPYYTCAEQVTCFGPTCQDQACITQDPAFPTCQAGPTCWPNDTCNWDCVPAVSRSGSVVLLLAVAAAVVLLMYRRRRARQEV